MSRIRRHSAFPHHRPVQVAGLQTPGPHGSGVCRVPAADCDVLPSAPQAAGGELTASPWLGLHYATEGS